jgi:murein DD-endopeptidase MepM/ murein hydrolase activator NlpD
MLTPVLGLTLTVAMGSATSDGKRRAASEGPPRSRLTAEPLHRGVHEARDPGAWPAEPALPAGPIDPVRFDQAFAGLCRGVAPRAIDQREVAATIRAVAAEAGADPFLLGALAYRQSFCSPAHASQAGVGLLQIQPGMFRKDAPLPFDRGALDLDRLLDPAHNLKVGAALLAMWQTEHEALDERWGSTPHRSAIAHFVWGDRVWSATAEDRVLTARRRLLERYGSYQPDPHPSWFGFPIVAPLEGAPRLGTSGPGADREGGAREHRGLDVDAAVGEPVRAVADGVVQFAGADMPGKQPARWLTPQRSRKYRGRFGPGGLFVRVMHEQAVRTGYFHLAAFTVAPGQVVKAGDVIGFVGRTGVKVSNSHLHFEIMQDGALLDPVQFMRAFVLPPEATLTHAYAMAEKKQRLESEKRKARRARLHSRRNIPTS